jgi:hypothetical protein
MWVVSFMPRPFYTRGKSPQYPFDGRLRGPERRSGRRGGEKILDEHNVQITNKPEMKQNARINISQVFSFASPRLAYVGMSESVSSVSTKVSGRLHFVRRLLLNDPTIYRDPILS